MNSQANTIRKPRLFDPAMNFQKPLEELIGYYENLTPRSLRFIEKVADPRIAHSCPLGTSRGHDEMAAFWGTVLGKAPDARIRVTDHAWGRDGHTVYLRWECVFIRKGREVVLHGTSEAMFSPEGLVMSQTDYWDLTAALADVPLLGRALEKVRARILRNR